MDGRDARQAVKKKLLALVTQRDNVRLNQAVLTDGEWTSVSNVANETLAILADSPPAAPPDAGRLRALVEEIRKEEAHWMTEAKNFIRSGSLYAEYAPQWRMAKRHADALDAILSASPARETEQ